MLLFSTFLAIFLVLESVKVSSIGNSDTWCAICIHRSPDIASIWLEICRFCSSVLNLCIASNIYCSLSICCCSYLNVLYQDLYWSICRSYRYCCSFSYKLKKTCWESITSLKEFTWFFHNLHFFQPAISFLFPCISVFSFWVSITDSGWWGTCNSNKHYHIARKYCQPS